ncbi:protein phosphatase 2C domain-containing protein [Bacillus sp. es.036]|uniref:protein phosphatase 2C domain-containing protein n=1 Tax=Bacillus sp. es.036 TaxID=1761764 RepID=UPI000BF7F49E|nr:protein phosphatase 2C domain-containing protein [Bacillus sp. es.036]PFG11926.1 ADP-ribose pyrophosphatase YjhB (NUDIX family) [Bacillus sp. es.036]
MDRNRAGVIIIQNDQIALIERNRNDETYYVIPGGGMEESETPQQAAKREALEELGVDVRVKAFYTSFQFNGEHFYYTAEILSGEFGNGTGSEYRYSSHKRGTYKAVWVPVSELNGLRIYPEEVISVLVSERSLKLTEANSKIGKSYQLSWVGSMYPYLDEPTCTEVGNVSVGRFGGNTSAGQNKNEDGCLVWTGVDWEFAVLLDAHKSASSAALILDEVERYHSMLTNILIKKTQEAVSELPKAVVGLFQNATFKQKCREVEGETACLIVVRKNKYLWWFSVGDCLLLLIHPELEALGESVQNHRSFYEWIGEVNTFDTIVPCYSTGTKELRKGDNLIFLTTDGLLECPHTNFHFPDQIVARMKGKCVKKDVQQLLKEIEGKGVRDSTTIVAWKINIVENGVMPSDL